ncbi:MAG TPA: T9SS type A sorting domain-containing protein [Bacteroidia bacterium]|nr:T9SS type A sorting domain-containing protein [Bacteroidia bacterium]
MKKLLLINILFFTFFFSFAQEEKNNSVSQNGMNVNSAIPFTLIGTTHYDLQSYGSVRKQIYSYPNGSIGAVFNYCSSSIFDSIQTAYNFFNGTVWIGQISSGSTSPFGNIDRLSNSTEVLLSYDSSTASGLRIDSSSIAGSNIWAGILLPPEPNGHQCGWPHMAVGAANGMSVHVISLTEPVSFGGFPYNGVDGMLTYSRSDDGGATWNIVHETLPGWDSLITKRMYPDQYAIDAKGNIVTIVAGGKTNDWVIFKSVDNGTTWTMTIIKPFPIPVYNEFTMTTDTNSNGTADTLLVPDGSMAVLIDNLGIAHCWSGDLGIVDHTPAAGFQYAYHHSSGLNYWNENMGSALPVVITPPVNILNEFAEYGVGEASMPSAGMDANNRIFVCYSSIVDGTSNGGNPDQAYRNIAVMATDNGIWWSPPAFLAPTPFDEQVFPSMARDVNSTIKLIFQQDAEPGMAAWGDLDLFQANSIYYLEFADSVILTGIPPVAGIKNEINIYPNPFTESTQLSFNNAQHNLICINLLDISGRLIKAYITTGSKFLLSTSGIEKGIYVLHLINSSTSEMQVVKLVKD